MFRKCVEDNDIFFIKESKFSYIRPIDRNTRLLFYNSSNTSKVEDIIHRGSKVIVEVHEGRIIKFISETFHTGVKTYDRKTDGYLPHLRLFTYIVDQNYVSTRDKVS